MIVRHRSPLSTFDRPVDRHVDRAFEQIASSFFDTRRHTGPVVNGTWDDAEYVLTTDLPGIPADAVKVDVRGTVLSLGATADGFEWHRSLRLGGRLDPDKVTARHVDGRLTIRIGTFDEPESRTVAIDTTPAPTAIEAGVDELDEGSPVTDAD